MADNLRIFGRDYVGIEGFKATDDENNVLTYVRPQGTKSVTENGTVDVKSFEYASVNVQPDTQSKTVTPTTAQQVVTPDSGKLLSSVTVNRIPTEYIIPTGTKSITENGTVDVTQYASASVNVPNSYSAGDEGKVVSNGALVAQTSDTVTANDTYDTTLINSLTVAVGGGSGITKETVEYTVASQSGTHYIPITGDVSKIMFVHFYDSDAVYPTNGTTYEGIRNGPAMTHYSAITDNGSWYNWRTHATSGVTGWVIWGGTAPFSSTGYVIVSANPNLIVGHKIIVEIVYTA